MQSAFCCQFDNSHFANMQITLEINIMVQAKVNREWESLGADLTSTDIIEGYIAYSKSKASSVMCWAEENNMLPLQTITSDNNEEALVSAAAALSLLLPLLTTQPARIIARVQLK